MITLVWNDVAATQLTMAAQEAQRLAGANSEKEAQSWARAAVTAAAAVDPVESDFAPFQAFADAMLAAGDEQLVKDAADSLAKTPASALRPSYCRSWEEVGRPCQLDYGALPRANGRFGMAG